MIEYTIGVVDDWEARGWIEPSNSDIRDDRVSFSGAASLANKFCVHNTGSSILLSFLEQSADGYVVEFRSAAALSYSDYLDLPVVTAEGISSTTRA